MSDPTEDRSPLTSLIIPDGSSSSCTPFLLPPSSLEGRVRHWERCSTSLFIIYVSCPLNGWSGPDSCHLLPLWPWPQFPHPQNEGVGFLHPEEPHQPIFTLSSQLFMTCGHFFLSFWHLFFFFFSFLPSPPLLPCLLLGSSCSHTPP